MNSGEMSGPATAWWLQVHAVYQPVVDLDTRRVVGYEALARGPAKAPCTLRTPCSPPPATKVCWSSWTGRAGWRRCVAP